MTRPASPAALREFYGEGYARLVSVVALAVDGRAEAEDIVQEAFARLVPRWETVAQHDSPEAWVRTVAFRLASNRRRKLRNGLKAVRRHGPPPEVPAPQADAVDVQRALAALPPVPELHEHLHAAAGGLRPPSPPPFEVVERRVVRRRRNRLATATTLVMAGALAIAVAAVQSPATSTDTVAGPAPLTGAVPEPTPYSVPTTPATDALPVVLPTEVRPLRQGEVSVPWQLIRLWDDQRDLAIQFGTGCNGTVDVRVEETTEHVLIQAVDTDGPEVRACATLGRVLVALSEPLAGRPLLHAATTRPDGGSEARSLAERFEIVSTWPGDPWFRDGRQVLHSELTVAAGPEHCSWQEMAFLGGSALPAPRDRDGALWARDPRGVLEHFPKAQAEFQSPAQLPADAAFTGYYQGPVEIWTAPSDDAEYVYFVNGDDRSDVERWVRGGGGCA